MADAKTARRATRPATGETPLKPGPMPARADPMADPAGYEVDFYFWSMTQADLLRQGRLGELDLPNVTEELEALGNSDKRGLACAYRLLIMHLLKTQSQPARWAPSWLATVREPRRTIESIEEDSPSLRRMAPEIGRAAYPKARADAARETSLPLATFPAECPYALRFLRDLDKLPE